MIFFGKKNNSSSPGESEVIVTSQRILGSMGNNWIGIIQKSSLNIIKNMQIFLGERTFSIHSLKLLYLLSS